MPELIEIHRGDVGAVRRLGKGYLRRCRVGRWERSNNGWDTPGSWLVPSDVVTERGVTPKTRELADRVRRNISAGVSDAFLRKLWRTK